MASSTMVGSGDRFRSHAWGDAARELVLRVSSAALHLVATWVVLTGLSPESAGIYYKGVVVALGLATLLRNKYELYLAPYIAGNLSRSVGIPASKVVFVLSKRLLIRASIICSVLLVLTADLDILEPRFQPYLETFLPFVISIPFVSVATLFGMLLRSADRSVLSVIAATFASNIAIIGAALFGGALIGVDHASLELYSWAYLVGSLASAALAGWFVRMTLRRREPEGSVADHSAWSHVHEGVASNAGSSIAHAIVLWGPPCLLALFAPAAEFASFAAAMRSSQIVEFLLPGLSFLACTETDILPWVRRKCNDRRTFLVVLGASAIGCSLIVIALQLAGPTLFGLYGQPYSQYLALFTIMLGARWMNGVGRPATLFLAEHWQPRKVQRILEISALGGAVVCVAGITTYGALAAAVALLVAWALTSGLATLTVLAQLKNATPNGEAAAE